MALLPTWRRSIAFGGAAAWLFVAGCSSSTPAPAPAPQAPAAPEAAAVGLTAELSKRFVDAMHAAAAAPLQDWDEGGLIGLHYLERDFGVQAGAAQLTAGVLARGIPLPRLVRTDPKGLASSKLLEKKVDLAWLRRQVSKDVPYHPSDPVLLILGSQAAVSACLAAEAPYNEKLLAYFDTLAWPRNTEWIRYGMYMGFAMHGCIRPEAAARQTGPLVKPLVAWLQSPKPSVDIKAYVLFGLAMSNRLGAVPPETLLAFVRAQRPDGTWQSGRFGSPAQNQTPLGAYVIAAMLRSAGYDLPQTDFRTASSLPVSSPLLSSAPGGNSP